MKQLIFAVCAACALSAPAFADAPLSADETKQATAAAGAWGCEGGKWEKESEGTGVFELDDAKCKGGQYDLKFDKDFKLIDLSAD
jgi:hypothetical protein